MKVTILVMKWNDITDEKEVEENFMSYIVKLGIGFMFDM